MTKYITNKKQIIFISVVLLILFLFIFIFPNFLSHHYVFEQEMLGNTVATTTIPAKPFVPSYISTPEPLKGIYMTSWVASSGKLRDSLVSMIDETEVNAVVIDIKDYTGKIVFPVTNPDLKKFGSEEVRIPDLRDFIESLHKKGIYVIARLAVFQDAYFVKFRPDLAVKNKAGTEVWKDRKGISWIDAGSREYWDYIVLLSKEARRIGFDEINFDYIRFPSDGNMEDISYPWSSTTPKHLVMESFFEYLESNLNEPEMKTSADLFGMVTVLNHDMGIGQILEDALPYFDYIMPMVYPSHYGPNFEGFKNPAEYPYEVVKISMNKAGNRAEILASSTQNSLVEYRNKLRPWLQDFSLGATYDATKVRAQMNATYDAGLTSWILWSPSNKYTRSALE